MTSHKIEEANPAPALHHDRLTISLHWATAFLVLLLFGGAMIWDSVPEGWNMTGIHVSLGIALAGVIALRLTWRATGARRLPAEGSRRMRFASRAMHAALYLLLAAQVVLGFGVQWLGGEGLSFFGLFTIPTPLQANASLAEAVETVHDYAAWTMVVLVAGHAAAALYHHYVHKDGVLKRMLPAAG